MMWTKEELQKKLASELTQEEVSRTKIWIANEIGFRDVIAIRKGAVDYVIKCIKESSEALVFVIDRSSIETTLVEPSPEFEGWRLEINA